MPFHVPAVDITPYVQGGTAEEKARVAAEVDAACTQVGFIQILGHGVPAGITTGLTEALDAFFTGLDLDAKKAYRTPPQINRGYSPPKTESLSLSLGVEQASRMNDFFEAFNVGAAVSDYPGLALPAEVYAENVWPEVPGFEAKVSAYFAEARRVARTLTGIFADALGLEPGFFDRYTDHSLDVMRMNNYALPPGTEVTLDGDLIGMGEHTDFGIVTVLWADQVRGLQVLDGDGGWNDVSPADGALLVNLGDVLGRWTNDRWMSTLHRVKPPVIEGTIERRRSVAFFHDGNWEALIETLPSKIDAEHPNRYPEPITVADHIAAKLGGSREGRLNEQAGHEQERVLASRGY